MLVFLIIKIFMFFRLLFLLVAGATLPVHGEPSLLDKAREQIGVTKTYDSAYQRLDYPGGDVPMERGVCTDVVIRAMRQFDYDLQKEVHEDMRKNFSLYPKIWGLKKPDTNIDHRRVPNLMTFFKRKGWSLPVTDKKEDYKPNDLVCWRLPHGAPHIGIVSNKKTMLGTPMIIHNIGYGATENDCLFSYRIIGHYRPVLPKKTPAAKKTS